MGISGAVGTWPATPSAQTIDDFYTVGSGHPFIDTWWDPLGAAATIFWPFEGEFDYVLIERNGEPYNEIVTDIESRVYVYTWVSELGEEGPPSPPSAIVTIPTDGDVTISAFEAAPTVQRNITNMRIYRANTGTSVSEFQFVAEIPEPSAPFLDNISDLDLGEVLQSASWDPPSATMEGIVALPNGVLAGFDGKNVCFSEPYFPHAWPPEYIVAVDHDVVGLGVLPQGTLVLTNGTPYMVIGNHPRAFSLRHFEFAQSCSSKKSIINTKDSVIYASPDGLVKIGAGGFQVITDKHFQKRDWNDLLDPTSIDGNWHDGRYFGFHTSGGIVFDPFDDSIGLTTIDDTSAASYVDAETDKLYYIPVGNLVDHYVAVADGSGTNTIMSSVDDGVNWVQATTVDRNFTDVVWEPNAGAWIAVSRDNATGTVFRSTDGLTWSQVTIDAAAFEAEIILWSDLHKLLVVGGTSAGGDHAWSDDGGLTWTRFASSTNTRVLNMAFNEKVSDPLYISYDDFPPQSVWTSTNGKTWIDTGTDIDFSIFIRDIAWSPSLDYFLILDSTGEFHTTTDGEVLTSEGVFLSGINRSVAWSETQSQFVAVGVGAVGEIITSPTGLSGTWTLRTNPSNALLEDVEYDEFNARWVATGTNSAAGEEVIFSSDGATWTEATDADFGKDWKSVWPGQVAGVGEIRCWDGDGATQKTLIWRTHEIRHDNPINLGAGRVVADSYPLTFRLFNEGTLKLTLSVTDDEIFRLPGGFIGDSIEIELEHDDVIRSLYVAESIQEILDG